MKWIFALNEAGPNYRRFAEMAKVAVHTAQLHTSLEPHFLYDGQENDLTAWMRSRGVVVIPCRSCLYDGLKKIAEERNDSNVLNIGAGTFMRTEIARVAAEQGWQDKFVFYTDADVMFNGEVVGFLNTLAPKGIAVAPEMDPNDMLKVNLGVMLINVAQVQADRTAFETFMHRHLPLLTKAAWDQTAYTWFYNPTIRTLLAAGVPAGFANRVFNKLSRLKLAPRPTWGALPPEYNWKPYWTVDYSPAKVIHFHGPKPYEFEILTAPNPPAHLKHLCADIRGGYVELCGVWHGHFGAAEGTTSLAGSAA